MIRTNFVTLDTYWRNDESDHTYLHKHAGGYRSPQTQREKREYFAAIEQGVKPRRFKDLPSSWDDVRISRDACYTKSWKSVTKDRKQYLKHKPRHKWTKEKFNDQEQSSASGSSVKTETPDAEA